MLLKDHTNNKLDDIFEYNWQSKFLYSLYINQCSKNSCNSIFNRHVHKLAAMVIKLYLKIGDDTETNYLAVLFEALTVITQLITDQLLLTEVQNHIVDVFGKLVKRYKNGLFYWRDGRSARIDITGHVLNGLMYIMKLDRSRSKNI
tara:strand:+ start:626 stop:1063 length:438 start_codon:yes stop_codon:yes gene_type:complete